MTSSEVFAAARERGIKTIRLIVHQPKAGGAREWVCDLGELEAFAIKAKAAARRCEAAAQDYGILGDEKWAKLYLNPSPNADECAFCKALGPCPAANASVLETLGQPSLDAFAQVVEEAQGVETLVPKTEDALAKARAAVDFVQDWIDAVCVESERRLLAGQPVPGFGLELGRKGARKWADPEGAVNVLRKQMRLTLEQACNFKVKSPTQIEALTEASKAEDGTEVKPLLGPRQWKNLQHLIVQGEPKPTVKPLAAIRKLYTPPSAAAAADAFPTAPVEDDLA